MNNLKDIIDDFKIRKIVKEEKKCNPIVIALVVIGVIVELQLQHMLFIASLHQIIWKISKMMNSKMNLMMTSLKMMTLSLLRKKKKKKAESSLNRSVS